MLSIYRIIIFFSLIFFVSCGEKEKKFTNKKPQNHEKRVFKGSLAPSDSLNLSKVNLYNFGTLNVNKTHLFISGKNKIVTIPKEDFENFKTISFKEGKGPQEILKLQSFDVKDSLLAVLDERQNKILTYRLPDTFKGERKIEKLMPHRVQVIDKNSYLLFSPMIGAKYLFNLVNIEKGHVLSFGKIPSEHNPMVYEGFINAQKSNFYFAGFSEPLLKKYSADGELLYSVATIDNYNTEANYMKSEGGMMMGYTPAAQFSTKSFDVFNSYWLVIPFGYDNRLAGELDVYNELSGNYIGTIDGLKSKTIEVRADNDFIYAISENKDGYTLTLYKNKIQF